MDTELGRYHILYGTPFARWREGWRALINGFCVSVNRRTNQQKQKLVILIEYYDIIMLRCCYLCIIIIIY